MTSYDKKNWVVYKLTCVPTGDEYIGVTCDLKSRFSKHMHYKGANKNIQRLRQTYGANEFQITPVKTFKTREDALNLEIELIAEKGLDNLLNIRSGGEPISAATIKTPPITRGYRTGRITVLSDTGKRTNTFCKIFACVCDCGKEVEFTSGTLRKPMSKNGLSCGCKRVCVLEKSAYVHGDSGNLFHKRWLGVMRKFTNPTKQDLSYYENVPFDPRWLEYTAFKDDMFESFSEDLVLCRKDKKLGFSKDNCFWGTRKQAMCSSNRIKLVKMWGETKSLREWSEDERLIAKNISYGCLKGRLNRTSVSKKDAFEKAVVPRTAIKK